MPYLAMLMLLAMAIPAIAQQVQMPDATDLKAAYCVEVYKVVGGQLQETREIAAESGPERQLVRAQVDERLRENAEDARRVAAYLLPRVLYLDAFGLVAASKSADMDLNRQRELIEPAKKCMATCGDSSDCFLKCEAPDTPELDRIKGCYGAKFLPF